ncbi:hypothetical protein JCM11251_007383 [Rhodosporidiobolus azoricus]
MQRFRRKSESKPRKTKGKERDGSPASSERSGSEAPSMARSASESLTLPEAGDFRTSLILPQMMKRFSLLRGADGQLVDFETMQSHLAQQRQTGRLTAYEVDAVLAQYRLQSAYEAIQPAPSLPKRKRIDWSKVQQGGIDEEGEGTTSASGGNDSVRASFATTSEGHTSYSMAPSFSQQSAHLSPAPSGPFLPSAFSPSANGSVISFSNSSPTSVSPNPSNAGSTTNYSYQFTRRGPSNSVFGGRTHDARGIKMLKSGSSHSIASLDEGSVHSVGSRKGSVVDEVEQHEPAEEGKNEAALESSSPTAQGVDSEGSPTNGFENAGERPDSPCSTRDTPSFPSAPSSSSASPPTNAPESSLDVPELSTKQLRRISHALDNIEHELSKTFAKLAGDPSAEDEDDAQEAQEAERRFEDDDGQDQDLEVEKKVKGAANADSKGDDEVEVADEPAFASPVMDRATPAVEVPVEAVREMAEHGLRLDVPLEAALEPAQDSNVPVSPTSPINDADLQGLSTFNIPSPTLIGSSLSDDLAPPSPALSDTEPVDPFYSRLQTQAAKVPLPPSVASSSPSLSISAAASPVIPPSPASSSPYVAQSASPEISQSPALSAREPSLRAPSTRSPTPGDASSTSLPRSASSSSDLDDRPASTLSSFSTPADTSANPGAPISPNRDSLSLSPRPSRIRDLSVETDETSTATPSGSSPNTPAAYSFPIVPNRADSNITARPATGRTVESAFGTALDEEASEVQEQLGSPKGGAGELTMSDDGPFDLSLGGIRLLNADLHEESAMPVADRLNGEETDELYEAKSDEESRAEKASPRSRTVSAASATSLGSSFHGGPTVVDSDEEELVVDNIPNSSRDSISSGSARPQSLPSRPVPSSSASDDAASAHLRPMSVPLDRRPSNELLQVLAAASRPESGEVSSSGEGDSDIVLEDLLALQDSLVRAAARRTARLASNDSSEGGAVTLATPSSIASSSMAEPFSLTTVAAYARTPHPEGEAPYQRKSSVEATSSLPPAELSAQLAGLGLTSLAAFDLSQPSSSSQRNSRRTSQAGRRDSRRASDGRRRSEGPGRRWSAEDEAGARDSGMGGPASSRMTMQTSQTSSLSPTTNAAVTPSTNQSDAFEFSSLVGSPESQWEDAQEHLREDSLASGSPYDYSASPALPAQEDEDAEESERQKLEDDPAVTAQETVNGTEEQSDVVSPTLQGPAPIDTESFLRVPRNKPRRDRPATTSMLVRDVRNQATLATIALKKQGGPTSPPPSKSLVKSKSIRKASISSPQLVSGPVAIPAVPIVKPELLSSPRSNKVGRSKSRKDKDGDGDAKKGLGLRFRMLLKKPSSRDQMGQLNGDEITPFVDFDGPDVPSPTSAPVTPPNQDVARFDSRSPDFPQTPDTAPTPDHSRSPTYQPSSSFALSAVEEGVERVSPAASNASGSPLIGSPASAGGSTNSRSLSRIMSRIRSNGRRGSDTSSLQQQETLRNSTASPEHAASPYHSPQTRPYSPSRGDRRPSIDQEVIGLGFERNGESSGRAPTSYHVGSPRTRHRFEDAAQDVPTVAPLSPRKHQQDSAFSCPPNASKTTGGHAPRASIDSMRQLWQAAEDLGLPPDKVQELVDSAYAQSPTTSSHAHSGSTSSTLGRRSSEARRPSEASAVAHRRMGSTGSRKSIHERSPTPPPAGRLQRQASLTSSRLAGPVPGLPSKYASGAAGQDASRLSVYSVDPSGSLAVPHSPSLGSLNSRKSSEYANSFIDFYAEDDDEEQAYQDLQPPPLVGRRPSLAPSIDEQLAMQQQRAEEEQQNTVRLNRIGEFEEQPNYRATLNATIATADPDHGDEVVWQVLDDLRNNRLSTVSKDSSFGFNSRHSSMEVDGEGASAQEANSVANLLRHRDRKRDSASIPPWQQGRYPSVYMKDEERLLALSQQGGIAPEPEGHFLIRPKEAAPEVPQIPQEYRGEEHRGQRVGRH